MEDKRNRCVGISKSNVTSHREPGMNMTGQTSLLHILVKVFAGLEA